MRPELGISSMLPEDLDVDDSDPVAGDCSAALTQWVLKQMVPLGCGHCCLVGEHTRSAAGRLPLVEAGLCSVEQSDA